jgi:hypothetical protein
MSSGVVYVNSDKGRPIMPGPNNPSTPVLKRLRGDVCSREFPFTHHFGAHWPLYIHRSAAFGRDATERSR